MSDYEPEKLIDILATPVDADGVEEYPPVLRHELRHVALTAHSTQLQREELADRVRGPDHRDPETMLRSAHRDSALRLAQLRSQKELLAETVKAEVVTEELLSRAVAVFDRHAERVAATGVLSDP